MFLITPFFLFSDQYTRNSERFLYTFWHCKLQLNLFAPNFGVCNISLHHRMFSKMMHIFHHPWCSCLEMKFVKSIFVWSIFEANKSLKNDITMNIKCTWLLSSREPTIDTLIFVNKLLKFRKSLFQLSIFCFICKSWHVCRPEICCQFVEPEFL